MRKTVIAGNWKMYKTLAESIELASGIKRSLFDISSDKITVIICPPFTALSEVAEVLVDSPVSLGAQNSHWNPEGAFTGEISAEMLKDIGARFVIVGHSERRQYFAETNQTVNKRAKAVLRAGLTPIVCVGETLAQREGGLTFSVLEQHIRQGLEEFTAEEIAGTIIAYEPVWAIGTGKNAAPGQAEEAHKHIRAVIKEIYGQDTADAVVIQYGGSVKPENIIDLIKQPDIDGALVGGASLTVESFTDIVVKSSGVEK